MRCLIDQTTLFNSFRIADFNSIAAADVSLQEGTHQSVGAVLPRDKLVQDNARLLGVQAEGNAGVVDIDDVGHDGRNVQKAAGGSQVGGEGLGGSVDEGFHEGLVLPLDHMGQRGMILARTQPQVARGSELWVAMRYNSIHF